MSDDVVGHIARIKAVVRQDAKVSYGTECPDIAVPEEAFIPVEITGNGPPELAVSYGPVRCHGALTRFSGTGGVMMQFWVGSGGPVRLLLEHQMHGFTPGRDRLITMQHGSYCPGGAGPDQCRVIYQWNEADRRLEVIDRTLASDLEHADEMEFTWETLSRLSSTSRPKP